MSENLNMQQKEAVIEAILFTMGEAVSVDAMMAATEWSRQEVVDAVQGLMMRYREKCNGIHIIELDGAYQMCTNPVMYDYIIKMTHQPKKNTLTNAMLETLAIIAYKQPVTRTEIEQIRGVSCSHVVNKLLEYQLITEAGRMNAPGRPILFATTEEFLRSFDVRSVDNLPLVTPEQMENFKNEAEEEIQMKLDV